MINFILVNSAIIISLYLIIILISFDPSDPSWLQTTWNGSIHNIGGIVGARCSDFLFFIFGMSAYIIPILILLFLYRMYIKSNCNAICTIVFGLIKLFISIFILCGLANLIVGNVFYFSPGGVIDYILYDWIFSRDYSFSYINLLLLFFGIIILVFFSSQFFMIIIRIVKHRLMYSLNKLKLIFYSNSNKKSRCQHIHKKLYHNIRIYPTIILEKKKVIRVI